MASLLDIGPLTETVTVRGVELTVQGITAAHLFRLFAKYPEMRKVMEGDDNTSTALTQLLPDAIATIIAVATGSPNDPASEDKARTLGAADQITIVSAALRLTFPQGFGPFVSQITELMKGVQLPASLNGSSGSAMPSHPQFSAALQTDTPGMMRGTQRRAN